MIAGNINSSSWCGNKEVADHASILPSIFHDGKHPQNRTKGEEATDAVIPYAAESKIISGTLSQVLCSFELLLTYASLIKLMYANKEWLNLQRKKDIFLSGKIIKVKCLLLTFFLDPPSLKNQWLSHSHGIRPQI